MPGVVGDGQPAQRGERLIPPQLHVQGGAGQQHHGRGWCAAGRQSVRATGEHAASRCDGLLQVGLRALPGARGDRGHVGALIIRRTGHEGLDGVDQAWDELVARGALHHDPLGRHAQLARVREPTQRRGLGGAIHVGAVQHHQRVVAGGLRDVRAHGRAVGVCRRQPGHVASARGRGGMRHHGADPRGRHEGLGLLGGVVHHLHGAQRPPVGECLEHAGRGGARPTRWAGQHGVAAREGRGRHQRGHPHRRVRGVPPEHHAVGGELQPRAPRPRRHVHRADGLGQRGKCIQQIEGAADLAARELARLSRPGHGRVLDGLCLGGDRPRPGGDQVEAGVQVEAPDLLHGVAGHVDHLGAGTGGHGG